MNFVTLSVLDFKPSLMEILWPSKTYRFVEDIHFTRANIKYPPLMYFLFWWVFIFKFVQTFIFRQISVFKGSVLKMKMDHYFLNSMKHYWETFTGWLRSKNLKPKKDWFIWLILILSYIYIASTWDGKYIESVVDSNTTEEVVPVVDSNITEEVVPARNKKIDEGVDHVKKDEQDENCETCSITLKPRDSKELINKVSKGYSKTRIEDIFEALQK